MEKKENSIVPFSVKDKDGNFVVDGDYLVLKIHKVMLGSMANHLKATPETRKAARSMRRMGYVIGDAALHFYGENKL